MKTATITITTALAAMMATAAPAAAEFTFDLNVGIGDESRPVRVAVQGEGGGHRVTTMRPVVEIQRVWIEPVYETVIDRVRVEQLETRHRDVPVLNARGHVIEYRRENYVVKTAHWVERPRQVLVSAGYWTEVPRTTYVTKTYRTHYTGRAKHGQATVHGNVHRDTRGHGGKGKSHGSVRVAYNRH